MSQLRDTALMLDEHGDNVGCAAAYEELLSSGEVSVEALIALALVYWETADSGIAAAQGISRDVEHHARRRLEEVLGEAVRRDPTSCEAKLWTMYCRFIMYDEPRAGIDASLDSPGRQCEGAFATMWRVGPTARSKVPAAQAILANPDIRKTSKGRYIASIIPAALTRLRLEDEREGR